MSQNDYSPWLDAGRPVTVFGIPVALFLVFLFWMIFPSMPVFLLCIGLIILYRILSMFGVTLTFVLQRILHHLRGHHLRGHHLSGRPWWYRRYLNGSRTR